MLILDDDDNFGDDYVCSKHSRRFSHMRKAIPIASTTCCSSNYPTRRQEYKLSRAGKNAKLLKRAQFELDKQSGLGDICSHLKRFLGFFGKPLQNITANTFFGNRKYLVVFAAAVGDYSI